MKYILLTLSKYRLRVPTKILKLLVYVKEHGNFIPSPFNFTGLNRSNNWIYPYMLQGCSNNFCLKPLNAI